MSDEQQQQTTTSAQTNGTTATGQTPAPGSTPAQTPANGGTDAGRTFTQDELEKIIGERLTREREKLTGKFADYDDLKAAKKKLDEYEAAQLSEQEKLTKRLKELEDAKTAAEASEAKAKEEARVTMLRAAVVAEAGRQRARTPDDAWRLVETTALEMGEDGKITGVEAAVKTLIDEGRLPTLDKPTAPQTDAGRGTGHKPEPGEQLTDEQLALAQKLGVKPEDFKKYRNA